MKTANGWPDRFNYATLLIIVGVVISLCGCTTPAGGSIQVIQAPGGNLSQHKSIAVAVDTKDADFSPKDVSRLKGFIIEGLRKSARYEKVYADLSPAEQDVVLNLSVHVEFVVGPNTHKVQSIESRVTLTKQSDGKTIGTALVKAHSEWALFGGHMTNAMAKLSEQIVEFTKIH